MALLYEGEVRGILKIQEFETEAEIASGNHVKCLRSDNGGEYTSADFGEYLK